MTDGTTRTFICKRCGHQVTESRNVWKKKPQEDKRVCEECRRKRALAKQTAEERAQHAGYGFF